MRRPFRPGAGGGAKLVVPISAAGALFLAAAAPFAGARAAQAKPGSAPDALVAEGARQFQQSCAFCHGPDATGGRGPDLIRSPLVAHDQEGDLIGPVIRNGRPDKGMPALALTDAQIKAVAAFLHARARQALDSSQLPKSYAVEKLLTGNAAAGRAYFEGGGGCASCHSATGDLKGVARRMAPLELEARMLYPKEVPAAVEVTLPDGEVVKGTLDRMDEFTVSLRDASGWYRSFARDQVRVDVHDPLEAHRALLNAISQTEFHDLFAYMETLK